MSPRPPIDPFAGGRLALAGRIVTMDDRLTVHADGVAYIDRGRIVDIRGRADLAPAGFEETRVVATGGTVFPGLIDLHNHIAYNALRLWSVPQRYENRDQWGRHPDYRRLVSGPMQLLGRSDVTWPAIVRYVEAKALVGGVTTTQGVALFSRSGARSWYQGVVRNVEKTNDAERLPEAGARIADVEATSAAAFLGALDGKTCYLLHLSEGRDCDAREHFLALQLGPTEWAIRPSLAGIHCAALRRRDFDAMASGGAAMIWSPLSNLLLYGRSARVASARAAGVPIGLGSDWSPTGSKNLLGELKVARLYLDARGTEMSDAELIACATRSAARILRWGGALGTLEADRNADLLVVAGTTGDPYRTLIRAKETDVELVMINGVARYGKPALVADLGVEGESITVGGQARVINVVHPAARPEVAALSLSNARDILSDALEHLRDLAVQAERPVPVRSLADELSGTAAPEWGIALDELGGTGLELRPRLEFAGRQTGPSLGLAPAAAAEPLSAVLGPLELDPLTVADDDAFLPQIAGEGNLPEAIRTGLADWY